MDRELLKVLIMADGFCKDSSCGLLQDALHAAIDRVAKAQDNEQDIYEKMLQAVQDGHWHCTGSDGYFDGRRAKSIANKLFTDVMGRAPAEDKVAV